MLRTCSILPLLLVISEGLKGTLGLATAALFAAAAVALYLTAQSIRSARRKRLTRDSAKAWMALGAIMGAFALVKATNVFIELQDLLRATLKALGLYAGRQPLQIGMTLLAIVVVVALAAKLRYRLGTFRRYWLLSGCVAAIAILGLARLISLHAVDAMFGGQPLLRHGAEPALAIAVGCLTWRRRHEIEQRLQENRAQHAEITA